jgi:hypothetical protein
VVWPNFRNARALADASSRFQCTSKSLLIAGHHCSWYLKSPAVEQKRPTDKPMGSIIPLISRDGEFLIFSSVLS